MKIDHWDGALQKTICCTFHRVLFVQTFLFVFLRLGNIPEWLRVQRELQMSMQKVSNNWSYVDWKNTSDEYIYCVYRTSDEVQYLRWGKELATDVANDYLSSSIEPNLKSGWKVNSVLTCRHWRHVCFMRCLSTKWSQIMMYSFVLIKII